MARSSRRKPQRREDDPGKNPGPPPEPSSPPEAGRPGRRLTGWRRWALRFGLLVATPLLFLVLAEGVLRGFGFGRPTAFLIPSSGGDALVANREFGRRFFPKKLAREPALIHLPANKDPGALRLLVLGGSAAQGVPDPDFGLSRMLEVMLEDALPQRRVEVVNAAMTAINSHVVLPIARDCAQHRPDVFVVYLGNNEVVGPYGPSTVFAGFDRSRWAIRSGIRLKATRLGQLVGSLSEKFGGASRAGDYWRGMEMFLDQQVPADDPRLEAVYGHYRANLDDICRAGTDAGAAVVLCTVATNLRDCPPFASQHRPGIGPAELDRWKQLVAGGDRAAGTGNHESAAASFRAALELDDRHAGLHFKLARALWAGGDRTAAAEHFVRARDLDTLRFRADSRLNAIVREVAAARRDRGVRLADVEAILRTGPGESNRPPGEESFFEHVHLRFEGNHRIAAGIFAQVAPLATNPGPAGLPPPATLERCVERLALTNSGRRKMLDDVLILTGAPPFTGQPGYLARRAMLSDQRAGLMAAAARNPHFARDELAAVRHALQIDPDDLPLHGILASHQLKAGDPAGAVESLQFLLDRFPDNPGILRSIGNALWVKGDREDAEDAFSRAVAGARVPADMLQGIGDALVPLGALDAAWRYYRRGTEIDPRHAGCHGGLGVVMLKKKNYPRALEMFSKAIALRQDIAKLYNNRVQPNFFLGKFPQALEDARRAVRIDPSLPEARDHLAQLLAKQGDQAEATRQAAEAVRLAPVNPDFRRRYAELLLRQGRTRDAFAAYRQGIDLLPQWLPGLVRLAELCATTPDPSLRDPAAAAALAERAVRITSGRNPRALEVLAAAHAAAGRLEDAVHAAAAALELAKANGDTKLANAIQKRIDSYRRAIPPPTR